ncbi:hypothetical protein [uncultured Tateyamaria sp.]|uniref:hypothetical protein n=1 Tax=Tateyamaria sp. 1078 TaxID=3417464 RepID=UPI00261151C4|nr:hypothetical protein [uncultured Tateyamaria sp.]
MTGHLSRHGVLTPVACSTPHADHDAAAPLMIAPVTIGTLAPKTPAQRTKDRQQSLRNAKGRKNAAHHPVHDARRNDADGDHQVRTMLNGRVAPSFNAGRA